MLKVTAAVYDWRNFKIQLNSNHYGMFLGELIKLRIGVPRKNIKAFLKLKKKKEKMSYFQWAATSISQFTTAPEIAGRESAHGSVPK